MYITARIGGDEFFLIIYNYKDKEELKNTEKRLIEQTSQTLDISGMEVEIGMTIGIASYPEGGNTCDELLSLTDIATSNNSEYLFIFTSYS